MHKKKAYHGISESQPSGGEEGNTTAITIALVGNPNSGKTSVFNNLTGSRQHVGNWPGVTVEKKEGWIAGQDVRMKVVDLPGTYSLTAFSIEEVIARDFIIKDNPDVVVDVIDASNLERNLYLAVQLLEMGANVVFALNMMDVVENMGGRIEIELLSELLGVPVVPMIARNGRGTGELIDAARMAATEGRGDKQVEIPYGRGIEEFIGRLSEKISHDNLAQDYPVRWLAIKLIENDEDVVERLSRDPAGADLVAAAGKMREQLLTLQNDDPETLIADRRYGFISGLIREVFTRPDYSRRTVSDKVDEVVANRVLGFPIFLFFMWLTFQLTFRLGAAPVSWIESFFEWCQGVLSAIPGDTMIESLLVDGIIGGVGGVVVFLPVIVLLFLAIAFLEDSGYMARAAFIMDRVMHYIGLHGKSFIPMLIGFGCSVPAIMATRTLENRKDRIITILIIPLMSCGARLPVYVLLAGAFFPASAAGHVIFSMYVIGIVLAIIAAKVFTSLLFPGESSPFVMELPPYRLPTTKSILILMWERAWLYLKKAGTVILAIAVLIWFLMAFPQSYPGRGELESRLKTVEAQLEYAPFVKAQGEQVNVGVEELEIQVHEIRNQMATRKLENSLAGRLGRTIEPVFKPLGFDWRSSIALFAGLAAKEVVVSTLGTVYSIGDADEESQSLRRALQKDPAFNPLKAYVLMLFVLLSVPCMATLAVIRRETNSWRWPLFSAGYHFALAWTVCFIVYQLGRLAGGAGG